MRNVIAVVLALSFSTACKYTRLEFPDPFVRRAEVVVVPGLALEETGEARGILRNRLAMAKLMIDNGVAGRLLVSGGNAQSGITEADKMLAMALELGFERDDVLLEPEAASTRQNAHFSAEVMAKHGVSSGILVTDYVHMMYALPEFRDAFESRNLDLFWVPVDNMRLIRIGMHTSYMKVI